MLFDKVAVIGIHKIQKSLSHEINRGAGAQERDSRRIGKRNLSVVHDEHRLGTGLDQTAVALFAFTQGLLRLLALTLVGSFFQGAVDGWSQPGESVLEEVIVRASVESFHRDFLPDLSRND